MEYGDYVQDNVYVVTVSGDLTGSDVFQFNQYLKPIVEEVLKHSQSGLIFDLKGVRMIDSVGIGLICGKFATLKKHRKKFVLAHISREVYEKFALCELTQILTFYSTTMEALHYVGTRESIPMGEIPEEGKSQRTTSEKSVRNFMRPKNR